MLENIDLGRLASGDELQLQRLSLAVQEVGFLKVSNTSITPARVLQVIACYRRFFALPESQKAAVDMSTTGSNRGWGRGQSEQVDPDANPDYKQVFDCGVELASDHPMRSQGLSVYAPNLWPQDVDGFREEIQSYFAEASGVAMDILRAVAHVVGRDAAAFDAAFDPPMALLRGNYYPERPEWAGARDFGIAAHTDYGCLTLLATDGVPGLEVGMPDGSWQAVEAEPGEFVINFGEMLEFWTAGRVKATEHRVVGSNEERVSVPLFFNPSYDTNVAPPGSGQVITAGEHLTRRYDETYVHLQKQN